LVREALATGHDVVLRVDVQGAETIHDLAPDALLIFLTTATEAELEERLRERKTESPEGLKLRIATARQEMKRIEDFDYVVFNPDFQVDQTVDTLLAIIQAEHCRVRPRRVRL
jgi:guanylate kinase